MFFLTGNTKIDKKIEINNTKKNIDNTQQDISYDYNTTYIISEFQNIKGMAKNIMMLLLVHLD